jgi:hypothetical protein
VLCGRKEGDRRIEQELSDADDSAYFDPPKRTAPLAVRAAQQPATLVREAMRLMSERRFRHLPVVENDVVCGDDVASS